ncbi:hypothetical protein HPY86_01850 [candidate division WOR-3 bacterium]|nr:hypothetical protein [candidate division WOR-3 bacterium]
MADKEERFPQLNSFSREELINLLVDAAKNWLAHDGLWFQAVESKFGMEAAIELDREAWRRFTVIEAKRIMERHKILPGGGIPALVKALSYRLYAYINRQEVLEVGPDRVVFRMNDCRVQSARQRKGLPDFPCKPVGLVEYEWFAKTIDERIETRCLYCPPDKHPADAWCAWEFVIR